MNLLFCLANFSREIVSVGFEFGLINESMMQIHLIWPINQNKVTPMPQELFLYARQGDKVDSE